MTTIFFKDGLVHKVLAQIRTDIKVKTIKMVSLKYINWDKK